VLDEIEEGDLMRNARDVGRVLMDGLSDLKERHPIIGDVRGRGLFIGFELVTDRETKGPATAEAKRVVRKMLSRNVLMSTDGPHSNVIKIKPPMVITKEDAISMLESLDEVLNMGNK
jgi:ethanolamine-phosphate phospho-lyase